VIEEIVAAVPTPPAEDLAPRTGDDGAAEPEGDPIAGR
jgi:hypothetical protein